MRLLLSLDVAFKFLWGAFPAATPCAGFIAVGKPLPKFMRLPCPSNGEAGIWRRQPYLEFERYHESMEFCNSKTNPRAGMGTRAHECEKLSGQERYRVRRGIYRMIYEICDDELIVVVVKVGHRKLVCRGG